MPEHGDIEVIRDGVSLEHLAAIAEDGFGDLVKAVVDVQAGIIAINIRPKQGNRSRSVEDPVVRRRIVEIVGRLVS